MKKISEFIPIFGICFFIILYTISTFQYPGGTEINPEYKDYKWTENYLCDLMSSKTYSGENNPAQIFAILAMSILSLSLIPFWRQLSLVFVSRHSQLFIGHFGALAMLASILIFTPIHDQIVYFATPLGFIAFGAAIVHTRHQRYVFLFSLLPIIFMTSNFFFWHYHYRLDLLPIIQKLAFATFFIWVSLLTMIMTRKSRFGSESPK